MYNFLKPGLILIFGLFVFPKLANGQSKLFQENWNDPQITDRIELGIEKHRKGFITVYLESADAGSQKKNLEVRIEQIDHEFLFGANIFMLHGFDTPEKNRLYEERFKALFNYATVPFYWKDLEPEMGHLRFAKDSPSIYRRPPPDMVVEFCQKHDIKMKGHTLIWDNPRWSIPTWWPDNESEMLPLIRKRMREIGNTYGEHIKLWDVVNEVTTRNNAVAMPNDFALHSFRLAEENFPYESTFILNFASPIWENHYRGEYSADYLVIDNLLLKGAKVDAIGIQNHFFNRELYDKVKSGERMTPQTMYEVLDRYSNFNIPIHITEITFPGLPAGPEGDKHQAIITEHFYKLWFSHPNVEAITWWNLADGTAAPASKLADGTIRQGEDQWRGGFLNEDLSPKPAYHVLNELINEKWKTRLNAKTDIDGKITFKGFYGSYKLTIVDGAQEIVKKIKLSKSGQKTIKIRI